MNSSLAHQAFKEIQTVEVSTKILFPFITLTIALIRLEVFIKLQVYECGNHFQREQ